MIDDLKKYIDASMRKKLKENGASFEKAGLPSIVLGSKEELNYPQWVANLVSVEIDKYIPENRNQVELLDFLNFELLYKQNIKSLVDVGHHIVYEAFEKIGLSADEIHGVVNRIASFDINKLDYFELFKEEIESDENTLKTIHKRINMISSDSSQGAVVSHAAKMTNPACKYPKVYVTAPNTNDGYIRTGNSDVDFDLHINAPKLKVFKFLSLKVESQCMLDLINGVDIKGIAEVFSAPEEQALTWVKNFNNCVSEQDRRTHSAIKQIYFPVYGGYHQLSLLQPSGLVFLLKRKVDFINNRSTMSFYGKKAKKDNKYYDGGYKTVPNLTVTRHGGDHPKNISGLNNKFQSYYLLSSAPPKLQKRDIQFPSTDFFAQSISYYQCRDLFFALHELFLKHKNNWQLRAERDDYYQTIFDRIIERMWLVRSVSEQQYSPDTNRLNKTQKTWLCAEQAKKREDENDWLDDLCKSVTSFMFNGYTKILGKKAFMFSDEEYQYIYKQVVKNKEALR